MLRKTLLLATVLAFLIVPVPAFANGPTLYWDIAADGMEAWLIHDVDVLVYDVYAEDCFGQVYESEFDPPWSGIGWITIPEDGEGPLGYISANISYWNGESWSEPFWVSGLRECLPSELPSANISIASDGQSALFEAEEGFGATYVYARDCNPELEPFEWWFEDPWQAFTLIAEPELGEWGLAYVEVWTNIPIPGDDYLIVSASRSCGGGEELEVVIPMMWLLIGPNVVRETPGVGYAGNACILISETHPSVERQNASCFPANDPDWTTTGAPCAGPVWDNGTDEGLWACDDEMHSFNPNLARLPLYSDDGNDLWHVYEKHLSNIGGE